MTYFVQLENPIEARRAILTSTKEVLGALSGYSHSLALREQQRETMKALAGVMADVGQLAAQLEKLLPEKSFKELEQYAPREQEVTLPPPETRDDLHDALSAIEARLNKL